MSYCCGHLSFLLNEGWNTAPSPQPTGTQTFTNTSSLDVVLGLFQLYYYLGGRKAAALNVHEGAALRFCINSRKEEAVVHTSAKLLCQ